MKSTITIAQTLREAAKYEAEFGFSPAGGFCGGPRCFLGAIDSVVNQRSYEDEAVLRRDVIRFLEDTIFGSDRSTWFCGNNLQRQGWTTEDAVAAFNIAADIAEADGV